MNLDRPKHIIARKKLIWLLISISLFFWLITLRFTNIGAPEPSPFWYASELPLVFWSGLVISFTAVLLSVKHGTKEKLVCIMIPVLYLYTLPSSLHDMVVVFDVYHVIPPALDIVRNGAVDFTRTNFPLSHIYYASNIMILDMKGLTYAALFPTLMVTTIVLTLFSLGRMISKGWAVIAPVFFLSMNWYMEYHMARQAFGVLIWLSFFFLLYLTLEKRNILMGILAGVILVCILVSHPGVIIIATFNLLSLSVLAAIIYINDRKPGYLWPVIPFFALFGTSLIMAYHLVPEINQFFTSLYEGVLSGGFQGFSTGGPTETGQAYALTNTVRRSMGIIQSVLALVGGYIFLKRESDTGRALFFGIWFISCYFWLGYSLTHNGFLIERSFLTALLPASVLAVPLFVFLGDKWNCGSDIGKIHLPSVAVKLAAFTVITILVSMMVMIPIAKNSVDSFETPSRQAYKAGRFTQENMAGRVWMMDTHEGMFRYLEATSNSSVSFRSRKSHHPMTTSEGMTFGYPYPSLENPNLPQIMFTDYFNNYLEVRYGNTTYSEDIAAYEKDVTYRSSRLYDSGGSRIYSMNP